jgi:threonine dehydrogenase-like Zn-dependent dehydrogenase
MHQALKMLHEGSLDLKKLITDRFKLKNAPNAFETAESSKTAIKTMIVA